MSKSTQRERLPTLHTQPLAPESGTSSRPRLLARPDSEAPREISPPNTRIVKGLPATSVEPERLAEKQLSTLKSIKRAMNFVPQTSSARFNLPVAFMPSVNIEANGPTHSQASTLGAVNPISQASSAQFSLPVEVVPPPSGSIAPGEIGFSPAKPVFWGYISEPKGPPAYIGGYSDVWQCSARFLVPLEALPQKVAVKVLRPVFLGDCNNSEARARLLQRLEQETRTWDRLDHPNIVPLIGWTEEPSLSLISPWYEQGNLNRHLNVLSGFEKLRLLLGIAKGLGYLHSRSPPVVHGDLKTENILLSDQGEPLLTDFGFSTIIGEEEMYAFSHRVGGSTPCMSPECMIGESRSCQSDVYSFGILAFTVLTGFSPHAGLTNNQITLKVCNDKDPKGPVEDWSKYPQLQGPVKDLLDECWARSPSARPPMSAVVKRLMVLLPSYELGAPTVPSEPETNKGYNMIWSFVATVIFIGIGMTLRNRAIR